MRRLAIIKTSHIGLYGVKPLILRQNFFIMALKTKYLAIVPACLLTLTLVSCGEKKEKIKTPNAGSGQLKSADETLQAEGFIVKARALAENISVPGTLLPFETTDIRPEISGRVVEMNIPEGRMTQKGALLVRLFDEDLQAQLKKLEVQLSIAEKTAERQKELLKINGISQQEYDLSELSVNNLKADIELVKVDIARTQIRAPYHGRIGLRNISLGAYVTPADMLTTISQVDELKLEFTVPEKYSTTMRPGRVIKFTLDGIDKEFTATVQAAATIIEANTRSLKVRGIVKSNDAALAPGRFAKVSLELGKNEQSLVIPTQAVIPQARDKRVILYHDGAVEFKVVTTGIRDSSFVEIADGLKAGDTVVITALLAIRPESRINLTKVE